MHRFVSTSALVATLLALLKPKAESGNARAANGSVGFGRDEEAGGKRWKVTTTPCTRRSALPWPPDAPPRANARVNLAKPQRSAAGLYAGCTARMEVRPLARQMACGNMAVAAPMQCRCAGSARLWPEWGVTFAKECDGGEAMSGALMPGTDWGRPVP